MLDTRTQVYTLPELQLESGEVLHQAPVAYRSWGSLNDTADNVVVLCHALTGDPHVDDWWAPLLGPGRVFDTRRFFVLAANVLGSPYGSVSPLTGHPETGHPYGPDFPVVTIRDTVQAHRLLLEHLGVRQVALVAGGSMGGMQTLEWSFHDDLVQNIAPIAVGGRHSAWCIGWSEVQRRAIYTDPRWCDGHYAPDRPPAQGLAAARMAAMLSYRTPGSFGARFGRERMETAGAPYAVESYLHYQGDKLVDRFDANCYVSLTHQMDTHDVARGRGAYEEVLASISQPALVIGIDSDGLYPLDEQEELAEAIPGSTLSVIRSDEGHDAFLMAFDQLEAALRPWMEQHVPYAAVSWSDRLALFL